MLANRSKLAKAIIILAVLMIVLILLLNPGVQSLLKSIFLDPFGYPSHATFTLKRTLIVDANGGNIYNYTVDIPQPSNASENGFPLQEVLGVTVQPTPSYEERYGTEWMVWEGNGLVGQGKRTVTVTYEMRVSTYIWNLEEGMVGDVVEIPQYLEEGYLGDEWQIIVNHPSIIDRSQSIVGDSTNVMEMLRSIYDWITDNIAYPTSSSAIPQTSVETLYFGRGDCDDQAILFCALARAAGIPAWLQLGILYDPFLQSWGGHGWVQTFIPLRSGGGVNATIDTVNKDFLVWRPNRFTDFTDDGNPDHLKDYYFSFHCSYESDTYAEGEFPVFSQEFEAVDYQESGERVQPGDFSSIAISPIMVQTARYLPGSGS